MTRQNKTTERVGALGGRDVAENSLKSEYISPFNQVLLSAPTPTDKALVSLLGAIIGKNKSVMQGILIRMAQGNGYTKGQCIAALNRLASAGVITINCKDTQTIPQPFSVCIILIAGAGL